MWATLHQVFNAALFYYTTLHFMSMVDGESTLIFLYHSFYREHVTRPHNSHSVRVFGSRFKNSNKFSTVELAYGGLSWFMD